MAPDRICWQKAEGDFLRAGNRRLLACPEGVCSPRWGHKGSRQLRWVTWSRSSAGDTRPLAGPSLNWWRLGSTENGEVQPGWRKALLLTAWRLFWRQPWCWPLRRVLPALLREASTWTEGPRKSSSCRGPELWRGRCRELAPKDGRKNFSVEEQNIKAIQI